jgi:4-carboxymuconolactone decarboxylase
MARLPYVTREDLNGQQTLWDEIARARGTISGVFRLLLNSPELARSVAVTGEYFRESTKLPTRWRALAVLLVANEIGNTYDYEHHRGIAEKAGLPPELIAIAEGGAASGPIAEDDRTVLEYVRNLLRQHQTSDDNFQAALALLGREDLVDLTIFTGYMQMLGLSVRAFDGRTGEDGAS